MKAFRIIGQFKMGKKTVPFTKEIASGTKDEAVENIYSRIGSKHRIKRKKITIDSVRELEADEIKEIYVKEMLEAGDADR